MNARIREIYLRSAENSMMRDGEPRGWLWEEEFARLIIQECIDAIDRYSPDSWDTVSVAKAVIRDHFKGYDD